MTPVGTPPSLSHGDVVDAYARWAPVYDRVFAAVMRPGRLAAAAAVNRIGGRVLDVGIGTGLELPLFAPSVTVTGIDLSAPMLAQARQRVRDLGLTHVEALEVMDAMNLCFPDASFDVVVAPYVLTVVPDPQRTLDEMARVVRPAGEIILVNHIGAEQGLVASIEAWLGKRSTALGWRPQFPWEIIGDWIAARPEICLLERRKLPPLGLFTLTRLTRMASPVS